MTHFSTCTGCAVDRGSCHMLAALKRAVSGLYVTTVKHRCERRVPLYEPGAPILVKTFVCYNDAHYGDDEGRPVFAWFPATFIRQIGTKGVAFVKPGTPSTGGQYQFETKIDVTECTQCGAIRSIDECRGDLQYYDCPLAEAERQAGRVG